MTETWGEKVEKIEVELHNNQGQSSVLSFTIPEACELSRLLTERLQAIDSKGV